MMSQFLVDLKKNTTKYRNCKQRFKEYGLVENEDKRVFREEKIHFLGYEILYNLITPSTIRKQGIVDYKAPTTKKELQRFLGFINYDRIFIKNITEKIKLLYKLLEKNRKFVWGEEENKTFENIKSEWSKHLELTIPDMNENFELETDASDIGLGAVLLQKGSPVAYISRSLTPCERNYSITEKEVLASLWAMEKFNFYLYGRESVLITDHKTIEEIKRKVDFGTPNNCKVV
jgi:hypothetical protein